ncbi:MAG: phosphonoacetate hydrolase [Verrucomicrobia bacterium]|nr:phosphonoacetate hydrolase [Verrucomicrobiota bacterium]
MTPTNTAFSVNGRTYKPAQRPIVTICLDGSADEYLDAAMARGLMPNLQRMSIRGFRGMARGALPSFTNVNNASIVTGVSPAVHGISGNYFYDPESGQEVMMNSAKYLRANTLLAAAAQAGRKVAVVTAKDKLREILSHGLTGIGFSAEKAADAQLATHGIADVEKLMGEPAPAIYSANASLFVLRAGVALVRAGLADLLYLSFTDYMQHKYEPEAPEVLDFYAAIDLELGHLLELGAVIGATADHGMNAKQKLNGEPNVLYLETMLDEKFGGGFRVILPITDPYVLHHGALGSFASVYLPPTAKLMEVSSWLMKLPGVTEVYDRETAAEKLEIPADRIGDLVVMSGRDVVVGRTTAHHDLSALDGGLRSHGGRYEEMVPFVISEPLNAGYQAKARGDLRNFDLFDFTINGTQL